MDRDRLKILVPSYVTFNTVKLHTAQPLSNNGRYFQAYIHMLPDAITTLLHLQPLYATLVGSVLPSIIWRPWSLRFPRHQLGAATYVTVMTSLFGSTCVCKLPFVIKPETTNICARRIFFATNFFAKHLYATWLTVCKWNNKYEIIFRNLFFHNVQRCI